MQLSHSSNNLCSLVICLYICNFLFPSYFYSHSSYPPTSTFPSPLPSFSPSLSASPLPSPPPPPYFFYFCSSSSSFSLYFSFLQSSSSHPPSEVFLRCFSRLGSLPSLFPIYSLAFTTFISLRLFESGVRPTQFDDSSCGLFTELGSSSPIPSMEDQTTSLSGNSFETCRAQQLLQQADCYRH